MKTWTLKPLAVALVLAVGNASAHGDADVEKHHPFDPAKVEDTAFGRQGNPKNATRTIRIDMADTMRFSPARIVVKRGETVRLVAANKGGLLHELVLGTPGDLQEHAALMKKFPEMEHDEANMTHVRPGKTGQIVWQFTKPGEFQFACLIPGHFEAGMFGKVTVK